MRDTNGLNSSEASLPSITRCTLSTGGDLRSTQYVECPRRKHVVGTPQCDACDQRGWPRRDASGAPIVTCLQGLPQEAAEPSLAPVSSVLAPRFDCANVAIPVSAARTWFDGGARAFLPVVDDAGRPLGVLGRTEVEQAPERATLGDLVRGRPTLIRDDDTVGRVASVMRAEHEDHLWVVSHDGSAIGMVSAIELVAALTTEPAPTPKPSAGPSLDAATVALVELGDPLLSSALEARLGELGLPVEHLGASAALERVRRRELAVMVLGAGMAGTELLRKIRASSLEVGVVVVGARGDEIDRIVGFELGADDFVSAQTGARELALQLRALARRVVAGRSAPAPSPSAEVEQRARRLRWRGLELDPVSHRVLADGAELSLRRMEYKLLLLLMERPERVMSRADIKLEVWGDDDSVSPRTVDTHVRRLRAALGAYHDAIETVHGYGYRLRQP